MVPVGVRGRLLLVLLRVELPEYQMLRQRKLRPPPRASASSRRIAAAGAEVRQRQLVGGRVRERERAPDDMGILFRYNKFGLESNLPHQRGGMHVCVFSP